MIFVIFMISEYNIARRVAIIISFSNFSLLQFFVRPVAFHKSYRFKFANNMLPFYLHNNINVHLSP